MAELKNKLDVFRRIREDAMDNGALRGASRYENFVDTEVNRYRIEYSFMQNVTTSDYFDF